MDMKEFKKLLKLKQEEVSEMQIRKDLLDKKLNDSSRDSDLMVEKLQRKLDDAHNRLKRKEKEFEETMDHLQADIDSLESERGELKDKVKQMSKKALIQGLSKSQMMSEGPSSLGPSVPSPVRDSPLLIQQGWKFISCSHCQELGQQASWLLIGCTRVNNQSEARSAS